MGGLSIWHWMLVLLVVLLLFGGNKMSGLMGDFAKGIKAFKSGMAEEDPPAGTPAGAQPQAQAQVTPPPAAAPAAPAASVAPQPHEHA